MRRGEISKTVVPAVLGHEELAPVGGEICLRDLFRWYDTMLSDYPHYSEFFKRTPGLPDNAMAILIFMYYLRHNSPRTLESYARQVCCFLNFTRKIFTSVKIRDVEDYIGVLQDARRKKTTVRLALAALRSFYKRMLRVEMVKTNPAELVSVPRVESSERVAQVLTKSLSFEDIDTVLRERGYNKQRRQRDIILFYTMARTGLRVSEACGLMWKDLQFLQDDWVLNILGKGNKRRLVVLPSAVSQNLLKYREAEFFISLVVRAHVSIDHLPIFSHLFRKSAPMTRQNVNRIMKKISAVAGIRDFSPHGLRHTCFTHMVKLKSSLDEVKRVAGHESVETSMVYIDAGKMYSEGLGVFNGRI